MKKLIKLVLAVALMFTASVNPIWAANSQTANNTVVEVKDQDGNEPSDYTVVFDKTVEITGVDVDDLTDDYTLLTNDVLVAKNENGEQVDATNVTVTFEVPNLVDAPVLKVYGNTGDEWVELEATINVEAKTVTATFEKLPSAVAVMYGQKLQGNLINTEANKDIVKVLGASSEANGLEGEGLGTAAATLDYNTNTYWHSRWPDANGQVHWLSYDLGDVYDLTQVSYLPRINADYINGDIFEMKIYVSLDKEFTEEDAVGTFAFDYSGHMLVSRDFHDCVFDEVATGRYVKVQAVHTGGDTGNDTFASLNEIRFYGLESDVEVPEVNKDALAKAIADAQAIDATKYTEDSYAAVASALEAAKAVNEKADATQEEVNAAEKALTDAMAALKEVVVNDVDKTALEAKVKEVEAMDMSKYSADSKSVVASALTAAKAVLNNDEADQAAVDAALKALTDAVKGLKVVLPFIDVKEKDWFYGSVANAYALGLMSNTGKGKEYFEPNTNISRGMVATVLYRMAGQPKVTTSGTFSDVRDNLWYTTAIEWAAGAKVVSGYGNTGEFGPDDSVLRQDLAIMLRNYAKSKGIDTNATVDFSAFKDGKAVDSYAASAVAWCVEAGLMSGSSKADGKYLQPKENASRAECAKMFSLLAGLK